MAALKHMTNATKANIIALVNALILCLQTFGRPLPGVSARTMDLMT